GLVEALPLLDAATEHEQRLRLSHEQVASLRGVEKSGRRERTVDQSKGRVVEPTVGQMSDRRVEVPERAGPCAALQELLRKLDAQGATEALDGFIRRGGAGLDRGGDRRVKALALQLRHLRVDDFLHDVVVEDVTASRRPHKTVVGLERPESSEQR